MGSDNLWRMYRERFAEEYRVGRDVFRDILHEHGLNVRQRRRVPRTTDSRHNLPTYPNLVKNLIPAENLKMDLSVGKAVDLIKESAVIK